MTFARVTTDDRNGKICAYAGQGRIADAPLGTFGSRAVGESPGLQKLLRYICKNGFVYHAAMNAPRSASILTAAFETCLDWEVYEHGKGE